MVVMEERREAERGGARRLEAGLECGGGAGVREICGGGAVVWEICGRGAGKVWKRGWEGVEELEEEFECYKEGI